MAGSMNNRQGKQLFKDQQQQHFNPMMNMNPFGGMQMPMMGGLPQMPQM